MGQFSGAGGKGIETAHNSLARCPQAMLKRMHFMRKISISIIILSIELCEFTQPT